MKDRIRELEEKLAIWSLVFLAVFIGVGILLGVSGGQLLREKMGVGTWPNILGAIVGGIIGAGFFLVLGLTLRNNAGVWMFYAFIGVGLLLGARAGYLMGEWSRSVTLLTVLFTILGAAIGGTLGGFSWMGVAMKLYLLDDQLYEADWDRIRQERNDQDDPKPAASDFPDG